jgi:hypothetical protein
MKYTKCDKEIAKSSVGGIIAALAKHDRLMGLAMRPSEHLDLCGSRRWEQVTK